MQTALDFLNGEFEKEAKVPKAALPFALAGLAAASPARGANVEYTWPLAHGEPMPTAEQVGSTGLGSRIHAMVHGLKDPMTKATYDVDKQHGTVQVHTEGSTPGVNYGGPSKSYRAVINDYVRNLQGKNRDELKEMARQAAEQSDSDRPKSPPKAQVTKKLPPKKGPSK